MAEGELVTERDLFGVRRAIELPPNDAPVVVAYGGGVNSTAMLCGLVDRKERVDLVLFADTGGERPRLYPYVTEFSTWLVRHGYPAIITVRKVDAAGATETLEQNCLDHAMLPSLAYGYKKCSLKFKVGPQDKYVNGWPAAVERWGRGERVVKLIGYDADEAHRAANGKHSAKYFYRYPLIEWGWGRTECVLAIEKAGLPMPSKSACFFCPSNTPSEIRALKREHPDLMARALAIEERASPNLDTVQGLGRRFAWRDLVLGKPIPLFDTEIACECYDGSPGDEGAA